MCTSKSVLICLLSHLLFVCQVLNQLVVSFYVPAYSPFQIKHSEHIPVPCVYRSFYDDPVKLFANWNLGIAMCGNKKVESALSTCTGQYSDRQLSVSRYADVLSEYRLEKLTYDGNNRRCNDWGRGNLIDPQRIGPLGGRLGQGLHENMIKDIGGSLYDLSNKNNFVETTRYHWTPSSCSLQVKIQSDGLIGKS